MSLESGALYEFKQVVNRESSTAAVPHADVVGR